MNGNENAGDIVTKSSAYHNWLPLTTPLLLWHDMDLLKERVVSEESKNRSLIPPFSQAKGNPQKSFKLDLWHINGD